MMDYKGIDGQSHMYAKTTKTLSVNLGPKDDEIVYMRSKYGENMPE